MKTLHLGHSVAMILLRGSRSTGWVIIRQVGITVATAMA